MALRHLRCIVVERFQAVSRVVLSFYSETCKYMRTTQLWKCYSTYLILLLCEHIVATHNSGLSFATAWLSAFGCPTRVRTGIKISCLSCFGRGKHERYPGS